MDSRELYEDSADYLLQFFVFLMEYPFIAYAIAVFLLWPYSRRNIPGGLKFFGGAIGGIWILYATYELVLFMSCNSGGICSVRNDLLVIAPVLTLFAFLAIVMAYKKVHAV